jgi:hypothetical protein
MKDRKVNSEKSQNQDGREPKREQKTEGKLVVSTGAPEADGIARAIHAERSQNIR